MIKLDLPQFRSSLEGCELALLADIETRTCLMSDAAAEVGQEKLDELCLQGALYLNGVSQSVQKFCVLAHPTGARVFTRMSVNDPEVLCLMFAPYASLDGIEEAAMKFLSQALGEAV